MIGPNGSGKTTVFNLITGIYRSTAGRMTFLGRDGSPADLAGLPSHAITALGVARTFQNQRLFNQMTVLENVLVGMHCRTRAGIAGILLGAPVREGRGPAVARARGGAARRSSASGSSPAWPEPAWTLSYANRRRLEIARALATEPRLLLLDEPAAGMNPTETRELMRDIVRIRDQGVTILLIEHDMGLVRGVCEPRRRARPRHEDRRGHLRVGAGHARRCSRRISAAGAAVLRLAGVVTVLRAHPGPQGHRSRGAGRRDRLPPRRQRLGKVDDDEDDPGHRPAPPGNGRVRGPADRRAPHRGDREPRHLAGAGGPANLRPHDGVGEPDDGRLHPPARVAHRAASRTSTACTACSRGSGSAPTRRAARSPAASSRCSRWPGR